MNEYDKLLKSCVHDYNWQLRNPMCYNGKSYSTTGSIVLEFDSQLCECAYNSPPPAVFTEFIEKFNWSPVCIVKSADLNHALAASPHEEVMEGEVECDTCDGAGRYDCPHCHTEVECDTCDGSGTLEKAKPTGRFELAACLIDIHGYTFGGGNIEKLSVVSQLTSSELIEVQQAIKKDSGEVSKAAVRFILNDKVSVIIAPAYANDQNLTITMVGDYVRQTA